MAVISAATSVVKKFYGKPMQVASKVLGVATAAAVIYDSHVNGKDRSINYFQDKSANDFYNQYQNYMISPKNSATISHMKKLWLDVQQDFTLDDLAYKAGGYFSGFGKTVIKNIPLLALSALTLFPKNPNINKTAGTFLGLSGIKTFFVDVAGIGTQKIEEK